MEEPITSTNAPLAKTTHFLGVVLSFTGILFAYSAQIEELSKINPKVAMWWPIVLGAATFIDRLVKLVISIISTFKSKDVLPFLLLGFLFQCGCASTQVRDKSGIVRFKIQGDASNVSYSDESTSLSIQSLDHSKTNGIVANGLKNGATTAAGIISTMAILTK